MLVLFFESLLSGYNCNIYLYTRTPTLHTHITTLIQDRVLLDIIGIFRLRYDGCVAFPL
jgi:hypothetical protein